MGRLKRYYNEESRYVFVTSKAYLNAPVFDDSTKAALLLKCINHQVKEKYINLFAWVIMPDHFHLLVEIIGKKNISQVMQSIKGNFSWMLRRNVHLERAHARKHELRSDVYDHKTNINQPPTVDQAFEPDPHRKSTPPRIW